MKKIIISAAIVVAVGAIGVGVTYAVFTAQDTITGNTISSATANLVVHNFSGNKPINTQGLVPGQWTPEGRAEIYNTGTAPMKIYMYIENPQGEGGICDKTNLRVATGYAGGNEELRTFFDGKLTDHVGPANRIEVTGIPPFETLGANISQVIHQAAQLDSTADNAQMNQTCTWNEVFTGETIVPTDNAPIPAAPQS